MVTRIPETGFLRLKQIVGSAKDDIQPIFPVAASTWWAGVKDGRYPKPVKHGRATFWRASDIRELCESVAGATVGGAP